MAWGHAQDGWRILRRRYAAPVRLRGPPDGICRRIVADCFDSQLGYFRTSTGHFRQFYVRDFGLCAGALVALGYPQEVKRTLEFALSAYTRAGRVTTQLSADGRPLDSFGPAADSLPFLLYALEAGGQLELAQVYRPFLEAAAAAYASTFLGADGLVRPGYVGSIKDHAVRHSSCYDNTMAAWLSAQLGARGWRNPLPLALRKTVRERFWTGTHFRDDLRSDTLSGDANVFPFWCGLFGQDLARQALAAIRAEGLDRPFPLKYTARPPRHGWLPLVGWVAPNYEGTTIWAHLGLAYLDVVARFEPARLAGYLAQYARLIRRHKNFLEVYHPDGTPFRSWAYRADEGMLWAVKWAALATSAPSLLPVLASQGRDVGIGRPLIPLIKERAHRPKIR